MLTGRHHRAAGGWALSLFCTLYLFILPGCSPKIVEKWRDRYVYQDVYHRDTIITKDSVYIREWINGDTVLVEKFRDRYVYRDRWRDSIVVQHDSVAVETTKEVQVDRPLSVWQRFKIGGFWWLLALAAIGWRKQLIWLIRKAASLFG